ncbi:hypothetical protein CMU69_12555 [Elizabethkingia anophelis]|nr:hypothetical protein [Elizabethkingia anophelis]
MKIIDYIKKNGLILSVCVVYAAIALLPLRWMDKIAFMPDFLVFSKLDSQDYFGLIIGAISSIFGVMMAVIILSVEFFKEKLNENIFKSPLENRNVQNTIFLSVGIISISFVSYLLIDKFDNSKHITLGYYIASLFVLYIYSVFPFFKNIIDNSSQIRRVLKEVNTLTLEDFIEVSRYRSGSRDYDAKYRRLKKDIDVYILENKADSYEAINNAILEKGKELINDGSDRDHCDIVLGGMAWLWRENCKTAIRVNDSQYFDNVWNAINSIYTYFADHKIGLLHLQQIEFFISFDLKHLYKHSKNTISLGNALHVIEEAFNENIKKNCPNQNDINRLVDLYENTRTTQGNVPATFTWEGIVRIISFIWDIQDIAIELKDKDLFEECHERIYSICSNIINEFNNLGEYQKGYLIRRIITTDHFKSSIALDEELYRNTYGCYEIHKGIIERVIEDNNLSEKDIESILKNLGILLLKALKDKVLFSNYEYGTFYDFYGIGVNSIKRYNESVIDKNIVDYFINFIRKSKCFIESDGIENHFLTYIDMQKALDHSIYVAVNIDNLKEEESPVREWKVLLNSFQNIPVESNLNSNW